MSGRSHTPTIQNRRARHEYHIDDTIEAGLVLRGCEVKSIRAGNASLSEAYAKIDAGEVWLVGMYVQPYPQAGDSNPAPTRDRKLLVKRSRDPTTAQGHGAAGHTLVPLKLYFRRGLAKVEVELAEGSGYTTSVTPSGQETWTARPRGSVGRGDQ